MIPGVAALNYTDSYQRDLGFNRFSETVERVGGRLESSFDSATGITTTYAYQPSTNYVSTETVTRNLPPVTILATYPYTYRAGGLTKGEMDTTCDRGALCRRLAANWPGDDLCA